MIQDAVTAGFLPKQPLETRFFPQSLKQPFPRGFGGEDRAAAKLFRKADEARQQTVDGHNGPRRHEPDSVQHPVQLLKMMAAILRLFGRADSVHRSSKRSFHGCLTRLGSGRLKNTFKSDCAWQHVTRIEDLCRTHVS